MSQAHDQRSPEAGGFGCRSLVGRGDLVRALQRLGIDEDAPQAIPIARMLGFDPDPSYRPPRSTELPSEPQGVWPVLQPAPETKPIPEPSSEPALPWTPVPQWRLIRADRREDDRSEEKETPDPEAAKEARRPLTDDELRSTALPPESPPIVDPARLRRRLDSDLRVTWTGRDLNVDRLIFLRSRGEPVDTLPYRPLQGAARLVLVLDDAARLKPFWNDILRFAVEATRYRSSSRLRMVAAAELLDDSQTLRVTGNEIVLALSDLGFYGSERDRERWRDLGRRLRSSGTHLKALVPCPAARWDDETARLWGAIDWSHPESSGRRRPRRKIVLKNGSMDPAEVLLLLLTPALRIEPGLVRHLRLHLGTDFDLSTEADLWHHPDVDGSSPRHLLLDEEMRRKWSRLQEETPLPDDWKNLAAELADGWHQGFSDVFQAMEQLHFYATGSEIPAEKLAKAMLLLERSAESLESIGGAAQDALALFLRRELERVPRSLVEHPELKSTWLRIHQHWRARDLSTPFPAGLTSDMLARDGETPPEPTSWVIGWKQDCLVVNPAPSKPHDPGVESLDFQILGTIEAGHLELEIDTGHGAARSVDLSQAPIEEPDLVDAAHLRLVTDRETVELERWSRPSWANACGRDGFGLWASFEIKGIKNRLRWVPPGRFWMGSPKTELGRFEDEGPRHKVVLTQGFWLGEVPCTQDLWQSVTGENPSRFKSPRRPVERVSWVEVQHFLDKVNFNNRDFDFRLPTEAEWEYACRAGTEGATWRGELESLHKSTFLKEIAWFGGTKIRKSYLSWMIPLPEDLYKGSPTVGLKPPNNWGLGDLLGNVYEWCWDWRAPYTESQKTDPEGPSMGKLRVARGGSRLSKARSIRASHRGWSQPAIRLDNLGFRLSRGPENSERDKTSQLSVRDRAWVARLGWAVDGGIDCFGRWADIEARGIRHRLRWIYPGRFLMGSHEDEAGRFPGEGSQREVTLTRGFWLGETPCTQDLWQAVMGGNPSTFQSPRRPVETVSWEDCSDFFDRLEDLASGFAGQLPSEAEWEYACRAGTQSATWLGELDILGKYNAPQLNSIAWYGGNSGDGFELENGTVISDWEELQIPTKCAGTRLVGLKDPNPWGLYDVLGNVWEWCEDKCEVPPRAFSEKSCIDPIGSQGSNRILRGGSWLNAARYLRPAFRSWNPPSIRLNYVGFRLSKGSEPEAEGQSGVERESGLTNEGRAEGAPPAKRWTDIFRGR